MIGFLGFVSTPIGKMTIIRILTIKFVKSITLKKKKTNPYPEQKNVLCADIGYRRRNILHRTIIIIQYKHQNNTNLKIKNTFNNSNTNGIEQTQIVSETFFGRQRTC